MGAEGKVALITGASSGIGEAVARRFAREGMKLMLAARRVDKLEALAQELGNGALAVRCDVSDPADAKAAVARALEAHGRLDVLINNAGVNDYGLFHNKPVEVFEKIIRINILGAIYVLRAAIEPMRAARSGHIVNVASTAGHIGVPHMAVYSASKFALVGLTQALRIENRNSGVTLTAFCPGTVDTAMADGLIDKIGTASLFPPKTAEQVAEKIFRTLARPRPEVLFGETPAPLVRLAKLFPGLADRLTYTSMKKYGPFEFED